MAKDAKTKATTASERTNKKTKAKPNKPNNELALTDLRHCRYVLEHDPVEEGVLDHCHEQMCSSRNGFRLTPHLDTLGVSLVSCAQISLTLRMLCLNGPYLGIWSGSSVDHRIMFG